MNVRYLLGIAIAAATVVAACGDGATDTLSNGQGGGPAAGSDPNAPAGADGSNDPSINSNPSDPAATNSPKGQQFYVANVHPFLAASCGGCHDAAGPGPTYLTKTDAQKSYVQLFQASYVVRNSRIVMQVAHSTSTTNFLTTQQAGIYNQWVEMELADGGGKAPPNVLEKLGACFSKPLFDAMKMGDWRTSQRTNDNNTNNIKPWNENADNCTGCRNRPCSTCHSGDPASHFNNAVGNNIFPADTTFKNTKLTAPAYIAKFFGVSPDGKPIASNGIQTKSDATMKDHAYTHPMFNLNADQKAAMTAFVNDAITKYNAGTCTEAAPATPAAPAPAQ